MNENIPDPSVRRLSAYLRQLEHLSSQGIERVSSRELAEYMQFGAATVRRDLALFGQFGQRGVGYEVEDLIHKLRIILATQAQWKVVVVGAGELSHALLRYPGFGLRGFELAAAFDVDPAKIGQSIGAVTIQPMEQLEETITTTQARLAVLAVPPQAAQASADRLVQAGIEGILNFSSPVLNTPPEVYVSHVDITSHLEQLSFHVSSNRP
jgi:redox-sensing transcriptional repressor